jgi:hypothetical protein
MERCETTTIKMDKRLRTEMLDYCVENSLTQRKFFELGTDLLLIHGDAFCRHIRKNRVGGRKRPPHHMTTLRLNKRVWRLMTQFCLDRDVSQREFFEGATALLVMSQEFKRRIKARKVLAEQQREEKLLQAELL